ncbi:MAG TPA: flagellar basal-body MS-ring/collar protein FliF [Kofleriaceae bacterium]|jgi:flagellar M-ring protein FliF|nr:flagellar basal-body MS-ring/collar protein FliF [Kofleriaceae bacterium]
MAEPKSQPQSKNQAFVVAGQLRDLWNKQPKGRRTLAVLVVLGVLGFVGITSLTKHVETWTSAADGISPDEAQQLYSTLVGRGISARFHDGKVEVHDDDVDQARAIGALTLQTGAGKGFETFTDSTLGQTQFAEQVNYRRALQTELARSIMSIAQVESARVNLAFGRHSVFKEQETAPTASVALHLRAGQTLAGDEVKGIRQLVASSIDGMKPEDVVVIDGHGHPLDASEKTSANDGASMEKAIADQVRKLLETVVGKNHVQVVANVDLDARKIVQTEDLYDKDSAAIRSQARTIEGNDPTPAGSASGVAGVRGNLPGATPASMSAGTGSNNGKIQETTNFEISHTQRHTENPEVTIKKIHLAVLVDQDKGKDGKMIARSKEQMAQLLALARSAAGVDDARGDTVEIQAASFAPEEDAVAEPDAPKSALPFPLPVMVGAGAGALVLLVVIGLVLRKLLKKKSKSTAMVKSPQIAFPTQVAELERVLDARHPNAANELPVERELPALNPGKSVQERVMDAVRGDVERAAGVLTAWLNEAPPKGAK